MTIDIKEQFWEVPEFRIYNNNYINYDVEKHILDPLFIRKKSDGTLTDSKNEFDFICFLEKNKENIFKHGITFQDTIEMFDYPMLTCIDKRQEYGEERWVGIGFLKGVIAVIIFTENDDRDEIRIISARKATKNECNSFKKAIGY